MVRTPGLVDMVSVRRGDGEPATLPRRRLCISTGMNQSSRHSCHWVLAFSAPAARPGAFDASPHRCDDHRWAHSAKEAGYAEQLDWRVKAGELKYWERQVPIDLRVNGQKICTYVIDFVETDKNDNVMYTEIKGFATSEWRFKWALFDAIHPDWEKQVIK